ncbi:MAG: PAS domain S-box protein [Acidobacteriota bacterium]
MHFIATSKDITESKREEEKLLRQSVLLNAINTIFREMLTCKTKEELGKACLTVAEKLTGSKFGYIGELNQAGLFDTIAISNPGWVACKIPGSKATKLIKNMEIRGIDRSTLREGASRIVNDPYSHPDWIGTPEGHSSISSFLGVPLKHAGKTIGMIGLANKESGYDLADQEAIEVLSIAIVEALNRKEIEEKISTAKKEWEETFDAVNDLVAILDKNHKIKRINKAMADRLGLNYKDAIDLSCYELFHGTKEPPSNCPYEQMLKDGRQHQAEIHEKRLGGDFIISVSPFYGEEGQIVGAVHVAHDITERVKAERALQQKATIVQLLQEIAVASNMASTIEEAMQTTLDKVCVYTGWPIGHVFMHSADSSGELVSTKLWHLDNPERFETLCKVTMDMRFPPGVGLPGRVLASRKPSWIIDVTQDSNFPRAQLAKDIGVKAGFAFPVMVRTDVVAVLEFFSEEAVEPDESLLEVMAQIGIQLGRVVERKQGEQALLESEEKYRAAVEESLLGVYIIQDGFFRFVNKRFCDLLGYSYDEVVDKLGPIDLTLPADRKIVQKKIEDRLNGLIKTAEYELRAIKKNGEILLIKVLGSIATYRGRPAIIGTMLDLSKEKLLELQLMRAQKMESLGQLAGGIAHDFNNILGIISGSLEIFQNKAFPEDCKKIIAMAKNATERGSEIVKRLLLFSRNEEVKLIPLSLPMVIDETISILEHTIERNITIEKNIDDSNTFILGNKEQFLQALLNICMNARDAMPSGGTIKIILEKAKAGDLKQKLPAMEDKNFCALHISDTGIGMDEWIQEHIFDPFFTTKEKGKGTGLGLSIVHGIIKNHKGFIDVTSSRGRGTTFTIYLPVVSLPAEIVMTEEETKIKGGHERILVVEDEEFLREILKEELLSLGYEVIEASNGFEALAIFKDRFLSIDLIILDIGMPGMTGDIIFSKLKEIDPEVHVMIASGYLEIPKRNQLKQLGVKEFIQKPYTLKEVALAVRKILDDSQGKMTEVPFSEKAN